MGPDDSRIRSARARRASRVTRALTVVARAPPGGPLRPAPFLAALARPRSRARRIVLPNAWAHMPDIATAAIEDALFLVCLIVVGTFSNELRCARARAMMARNELSADLLSSADFGVRV